MQFILLYILVTLTAFGTTMYQRIPIKTKMAPRTVRLTSLEAERPHFQRKIKMAKTSC